MMRPNVDMMEALRLTRQGRLQEAMAVLQGAPVVDEAATPGPQARERMATVLDMVPPSSETGNAWTAPRTSPPKTLPFGVRKSRHLRKREGR